MNTDELIQALADRLEPTTPAAPLRALFAGLGAGVAVSMGLMLAWLGLRPDFMTAAGTPMFWVKFAYTLALGALAFWAAERMGRPGAPERPAWRRLELLVLGALAVGMIALMLTPEAARAKALMGHSALVCPWCILALALPILVGAMAGMRRLAPTRPAMAGGAAGMAAGGLGAFVYAFSCNESAMPFVALWYTLPIIVAGVLGAIVGRYALRW